MTIEFSKLLWFWWNLLAEKVWWRRIFWMLVKLYVTYCKVLCWCKVFHQQPFWIPLSPNLSQFSKTFLGKTPSHIYKNKPHLLVIYVIFWYVRIPLFISISICIDVRSECMAKEIKQIDPSFSIFRFPKFVSSFQQKLYITLYIRRDIKPSVKYESLGRYTFSKWFSGRPQEKITRGLGLGTSLFGFVTRFQPNFSP